MFAQKSPFIPLYKRERVQGSPLSHSSLSLRERARSKGACAACQGEGQGGLDGIFIFSPAYRVESRFS